MGALRRWYRTCLTSHSDPVTTATATHMPPPMAPTAVAMAMATPMAAPAATAMATPMAGATTTRCSSLFVRHEAQLGGRMVARVPSWLVSGALFDSGGSRY